MKNEGRKTAGRVVAFAALVSGPHHPARFPACDGQPPLIGARLVPAAFATGKLGEKDESRCLSEDHRSDRCGVGAGRPLAPAVEGEHSAGRITRPLRGNCRARFRRRWRATLNTRMTPNEARHYQSVTHPGSVLSGAVAGRDGFAHIIAGDAPDVPAEFRSELAALLATRRELRWRAVVFRPASPPLSCRRSWANRRLPCADLWTGGTPHRRSSGTRSPRGRREMRSETTIQNHCENASALRRKHRNRYLANATFGPQYHLLVPCACSYNFCELPYSK
jgi:hypothetical protein